MPKPTTVRSARINAKKRETQERQVKKKKRSKGQRAKPSTPTQAICALIGEEEQNGNQKKKKNKERGPNPAILDPLVASYNPHGPYGGPILKHPPAHSDTNK